jgi:hypothetical protein
MTPKQRFVTAVSGGVPDMVPCSPLIHCRYADKILGSSDWKSVFEVHRRLGSVHHRGPVGLGWSASMPPGYEDRSEVVARDGARTETRSWLTTPRGTLTSLSVSGMIPGDPLTGKTVEYMVKEPEDWRVYADWMEQSAAAGRSWPDQALTAYETMGEDGSPSVGMGSLFAQLGSVRGMQQLILDQYDCPDLLEACAQPIMHIFRKTGEAFAQLPNEVAWIDICWATGAEIGLEHMERWALRSAREVIEAIHSAPGHYVGYYTLGRIRRYVPALVDTGIDFIETFEQNQGDLSLAEAKKLYGKRVCLMGNFDCVILARGTLEEARTEARRCLREGMDGGGYVMVTADEVPADAKWDNLRAMVEVCEEEGVY